VTPAVAARAKGRSATLCVKVAGIYIAALVVPFLLENAADLFKVRPYDYRGRWQYAIFEAGYWYQRITTAGPRKPRTHFVRIVTIREGKEPAEVRLLNVCSQRQFMARLLQKVGSANPAVIVVDKWYAPDTCAADDPGTEELRHALRTISQRIPIIVALDAYDEVELRRAQPGVLAELVKKGFKSSELILKPALALEEGKPSAGIGYGLAALNYDTRKIPLSWPTYNSFKEVGRERPRMLATLAVAAAAKYDPDFSARGPFGELGTKGRHPFTNFLTEEQMRPYSAIDLMCNQEHEKQFNWRLCQADEGNKNYLDALRSRIVIIGEVAPDQDFHETAVGELPGVVLQANYVESLLDDRYLRPVAAWIQFLVSLIWFAIVELIFQRFSQSPERALFWALCSSGIVALLFYYFAVVLLGYYLVLWPVGLLAVGFRYCSLRLPKVERQEKTNR